MEKLVKEILAEVEAIKADIVKEGNKAAAARVRKATLKLEKLGIVRQVLLLQNNSAHS